MGAGGLQVIRYQKSRTPDDFRADSSRRQVREVAGSERAFEFMLNALRLRDGVSESLFTAHTGLGLPTIAKTLDRLRGRGLMCPDRIGTTALGFRHLDSVVGEFLPEDADAG